MVSKFPHCKRDRREEKPEGVISLAPLQMPKTSTCEDKNNRDFVGGQRAWKASENQ
jgi:hypothetical protein